MEILETIQHLDIPDKLIWPPYEMDRAAYQIFLVLQHNPTIAISQLANGLGYSTTLVNSRIRSLKEQGFIRADKEISVPFLGNRIQTEVEADYDPFALQLSRLNIFLHGVRSLEKLQELEQLLAIHPYSHYHVASFGNQATLFCQFDIPETGIVYLEELLDRLIELDYFNSYSTMLDPRIVKTRIDPTRWLIQSQSWLVVDDQLNSATNDSELDFLWNDFQEINTDTAQIHAQTSTMKKLDKIDLQLVRELTVNANPNISELSKHYAISRSRLSRRLKRIRQEVIREERLVFDNSVYNLTYGQIIRAQFRQDDPLQMQSLYQFLNQNAFPFNSQVIMTETEFIWLIVSTPAYAAMLSRFVWEHTDDIELFQLDLNSSQTYYLYPNSYSDDQGWIDTRDFIFVQPLELLKQMKQNL